MSSNYKRAIRERMAATGETYTAARAAIEKEKQTAQQSTTQKGTQECKT